MSEKTEVWRLYVLPYAGEEIQSLAVERFYIANGLYILVYSNKEREAKEMEESDLWRLNAQEKKWLEEANSILLMEDALKRKESIGESIKEKLRLLETALEKAETSEQKNI